MMCLALAGLGPACTPHSAPQPPLAARTEPTRTLDEAGRDQAGSASASARTAPLQQTGIDVLAGERGAVRPSSPAPWTHLQVPRGEEGFHFVVVADRSGGVRPGVFEAAVLKINAMMPDLVLSVGDLIQGYTRDPARAAKQWEEFDALASRLRAPFFYVPGNHDVSNPMLEALWRERRGPLYYAFVYRNVLFIALNTMDGALHQIEPGQLAWLEHTLAAHSGVTWTLMFMHTPLWEDAYTPNSRDPARRDWAKVEALLAGRKYTAFAGHYHRYVKHERGAQRLFTLATTGGGSQLRGIATGEIDQIAWVTMTPEGPVLANVLLDGIWDENLRTEHERLWQMSYPRDRWVSTEVLYYDEAFLTGTASLTLRNLRSEPLEFTVRAGRSHGVQLTPDDIQVSIPAGEQREQRFELSAAAPVSSDLFVAPFEWKAVGGGTAKEPWSQSGRGRFVGVRLAASAFSRSVVTVDANLKEWGKLPIVVEKPRQIAKTPSAWRGPVDGSFMIGVRHDAESLYVAVRARDDSVSASAAIAPWKQDGIELHLDARPELHLAGSGKDKGADDGILRLALSPRTGKGEPWLVRVGAGALPEGVVAACQKTREGFSAELAIPRSFFAEQRAKAAGLGAKGALRVRINVALDDKDPDGQSQLWWWPEWRSSQDVPGSGTFQLGDMAAPQD